jgi:putative DNA-invertase from lambdoid prophage Rac
VCDTLREFMRRGVVVRTVINGFTFDGATKDPVQKAIRDALIAFMAAKTNGKGDTFNKSTTTKTDGKGDTFNKSTTTKTDGKGDTFTKSKSVSDNGVEHCKTVIVKKSDAFGDNSSSSSTKCGSDF